MGDSALTTYDDKTTGWKFTGDDDVKVGFNLQDISHDGHAFAASIRLERIAVAGFSDNDGYRVRNDIANHHVFGLGDCKVIEKPKIVKLAKGTTDPLGYYAPKLKAAAKYEMSSLVYETDQKMEMELAFLFTAYNKDPSHEPGGVIPAARIYPTFKFNIPGITHKKKKRTYRRATALQALFRIHIQLDDKGIGNQVGIFTDLEDLSPLGGVLSAKATGGRPGAFTFLMAEKPVPFEVVGRGVAHGGIGGWDNRIQGWDNIHQWSHPATMGFDKEDEGFKNQPFTPGLPYGGHIHWRWGETAATGAMKLPGGKQYAGPQGPGTPLIDDAIRDQNIEFAIIDGSGWLAQDEDKLLKKIDQNPVSFMFKDFSDVWSDVHPIPEVMMPSGNPVIYMSITAWGPAWNLTDAGYKELYPGSGVSPDDFPEVEHGISYYLEEWGGTMFPQGVFFPHEDDTYLNGTPIKLIPGVRKYQYLPKNPKQTWRR